MTTTNGHAAPIPTKPAATPAERPTFRRLVVDVYEVGADGKEFVLETCAVDDFDIMRECRARGLEVELDGAGACVGRVIVGGTVDGGKVYGKTFRLSPGELFGSAPEEVLGTTPSGEAVRMAESKPASLPTTWCRACQLYVYTDSSRACGRCGGTQTEAADEAAKKEDPVRMVGAERAEAVEGRLTILCTDGKHEVTGDGRRCRTCGLTFPAPPPEMVKAEGKMPSERLGEITRELRASFGSSGAAVLAIVGQCLDERLGRSDP